MKSMAPALSLLATLALAGGLVVGAGTAIAWHDADASALRLSWTAHPERIETCRERTAAELAERPAHMRQALDCVGTAATYLLEVRVDGALIDSAVVRGSGIRNDRPIFLLRDYPVRPGERSVRVSFTRREPSAGDDEHPDGDQDRRDADADGRPTRGTARTVAPRLDLETRVRFEAESVLLVTIQDGTLVLRMRAARARTSS